MRDGIRLAKITIILDTVKLVMINRPDLPERPLTLDLKIYLRTGKPCLCQGFVKYPSVKLAIFGQSLKGKIHSFIKGDRHTRIKLKVVR